MDEAVGEGGAVQSSRFYSTRLKRPLICQCFLAYIISVLDLDWN